ncbi:hypothetical protein B566_EDAN005907 [Ephemera danica]|nr:hypothetical protein B566_EDAN005907 [Ephemera danica]
MIHHFVPEVKFRSYLHEFIPHSPRCDDRGDRSAELSSSAEVLDHDGGIPIFRLRSAEETEVAHDLLELSRSLPPLPPPGQASAVPLSSLHEHERHLSEPDDEDAKVCKLIKNVVYMQIVNLGNVRVSNRLILVYNSSHCNVVHYEEEEEEVETTTCYEPPSEPSGPPLTPPTSEYSSDAENNSPNLQLEQPKTYTYDALLVADGRSKRRGTSESEQDRMLAEEEEDEDGEIPPASPSAPSVGGKPRYTCPECGKQYATSSNLSRHKQTHRSLDSQSAKKCPTCGKAYVSMPALAMHVLTHNLSHKCNVCGKAFSRPWLLQGHLRSHTGEKPYGCAHCGKAFADRSNLRAHMQTHSAAKNFRCKRCDKSFALKSYLNKHYESACFKEGESPISDTNSIDGEDDCNLD